MLYPVKSANGKYGFKEKNEDTWAIPPMYEDVKGFFNGHVAIATIKEGRSILINKKNENITGKIYSKVEKPLFGYMIVREVNLGEICEGVVDVKGNEIAKAEDMWIIDITRYGTAPIMQNDKYGVINLKTKQRIPCIYDSIIDFFEDSNVAVAKVNDKYGVIDWNNDAVIPFVYDSLTAYGNIGVIVTRVGKKEGLVDMKGNVLYPPEYDDVFVTDKGIQLKKIEITFVESKKND